MKSEKTKFREKEIQKKTSENFRKKRKRKSEKVSEYRKVAPPKLIKAGTIKLTQAKKK